MGYCYQGRSLVCDHCGNIGGVRKNMCIYKVCGLSACYPPALCAECVKLKGGKKAIHGDWCRDYAARANAERDLRDARLAAGEYEVCAAVGDWHNSVPTGMVGVWFRNGANVEISRLIPDADYNPSTKHYLSDYPRAIEWVL